MLFHKNWRFSAFIWNFSFGIVNIILKHFFERWCLPSCHQLSKSSEGDNVCMSKKTDRHTVQTDKIYSFVLILKNMFFCLKSSEAPKTKEQNCFLRVNNEMCCLMDQNYILLTFFWKKTCIFIINVWYLYFVSP